MQQYGQLSKKYWEKSWTQKSTYCMGSFYTKSWTGQNYYIVLEIRLVVGSNGWEKADCKETQRYFLWKLKYYISWIGYWLNRGIYLSKIINFTLRMYDSYYIDIAINWFLKILIIWIFSPYQPLSPLSFYQASLAESTSSRGMKVSRKKWVPSLIESW